MRGEAKKLVLATPRSGEGGPRTCAVEGATAARRASVQHAPPPPFGRSPSPAPFHCAGADRQNHSRDASAPELCQRLRHSKDSLPADKAGRRSADRRTIHWPYPFAPFPSVEGREGVRQRATNDPHCRQVRSLRNRPARESSACRRARLSALHRGACRSDRTLRLSPGRASRHREGAGVSAALKEWLFDEQDYSYE
jgi:hypothetical protein